MGLVVVINKIPPHNLREIIEATMILIDEEDVPFENSKDHYMSRFSYRWY